MQPSEFAFQDETSVSPFEDIATLHALYGQRLYRFLLLQTRDQDMAQSLTQDTFTNAWKARDSFRGDCAIYTWLSRIALNLVRDHTRTEMFRFWKRAQATALEATDLAHQLRHPSASAEANMLAREKLSAVWNAVKHLSPRQRSIFLLRFVEEMELNEIAEVTNLPLPTVKSHLYRALDAVRNRVAPTPTSKRGRR